MFDFDPQPAKPVAPPPPAARPHSWQGQWLVPMAGGGTLVVGLNLVWAAEPPAPPVPVSVAAFSAVAPASPPPPPAPGVALQVYDHAQAARFTASLARFDTPALMAYAAQTRADMALRNQPMAADLADALALIEAEIARRAAAG